MASYKFALIENGDLSPIRTNPFGALGIEIEDEEIAKECSLGTVCGEYFVPFGEGLETATILRAVIDASHFRERGSYGSTHAFPEFPPKGATLAITSATPNTIGTMAVYELLARRMVLADDMDPHVLGRVILVNKSDVDSSGHFGAGSIEAVNPPPEEVRVFPNRGIARACQDNSIALSTRVWWMMRFLLYGEEPEGYPSYPPVQLSSSSEESFEDYMAKNTNPPNRGEKEDAPKLRRRLSNLIPRFFR